MKNLRAIAMYLPQFHPIPENDEWWGKGFTEWRNVTKAKPLFNDHYQPHLPADLGFYDLRLAEAREAQAELAKEYGIYGFCYYHYWFNGKRVLERPFQEVFETGKPDFPFMLCWANENWTRVWDGGGKHILLEQRYSLEDDVQHITSLIPYFKDSRYIKIDGKPVFAVYSASRIPDVSQTIRVWREVAQKHGIELYICQFESLGGAVNNPHEVGFDASIEFQPHGALDEYKSKNRLEKTLRDEISVSTLTKSVRYRLSKKYREKFASNEVVEFYEVMMSLALNSPAPNYKRYPCVTPGWDNSSRRKKGYMILKNSTPILFKHWLQSVVNTFKPYSKEENFVFINAWNEWAEGNHLEPCLKWGTQYLEVVKELFSSENPE
jgi:hypothetical protein